MDLRREDRPAPDTAAPAVLFAYSPHRGGNTPSNIGRPFKVRCRPAYAGFNQLHKEDRIQEVWWAHYLDPHPYSA